MQEDVKMLIKEGRLEIANGGWVSSDEACPNYEDMINNMVMGHAFLKKEFGIRPRIGWQLDAFGHSSANARLFADFGFDAVFMSRADREDRKQKEKSKSLEFLWRPFSKHFGTRK